MAWSGAADAHGVGVTSSTGGHLDLLIIPPDVPVRLAGAAAGQAIDPANTSSPTAILTRTMPAFLHDDGLDRSPEANPAGRGLGSTGRVRATW
jgi:hypothetical protein